MPDTEIRNPGEWTFYSTVTGRTKNFAKAKANARRVVQVSTPNAPWWLPEPPPYTLSNCVAQIGLVACDRNKVQGLLEDVFVGCIQLDPAGTKVTLLSDKLMLLCLHAKLSLEYEAEQGSTNEREAGLWAWIKFEYLDRGKAAEICAWVPLVLFVDAALAVSAGREILGYPKVQGRFRKHSPSPTHANWNLDVAIESMAVNKPSGEARFSEILKITGSMEPEGPTPDLMSLARDFLNEMALGANPAPDLANGFQCLCPRYSVHPSGFERSDCVLVASCIKTYSGEQPIHFGKLSDNLELSLCSNLSFPMDDSLGVKPGSKIVAGFWSTGTATMTADAVGLLE